MIPAEATSPTQGLSGSRQRCSSDRSARAVGMGCPGVLWLQPRDARSSARRRLSGYGPSGRSSQCVEPAASRFGFHSVTASLAPTLGGRPLGIVVLGTSGCTATRGCRVRTKRRRVSGLAAAVRACAGRFRAAAAERSLAERQLERSVRGPQPLCRARSAVSRSAILTRRPAKAKKPIDAGPAADSAGWHTDHTRVCALRSGVHVGAGCDAVAPCLNVARSGDFGRKLELLLGASQPWPVIEPPDGRWRLPQLLGPRTRSPACAGRPAQSPAHSPAIDPHYCCVHCVSRAVSNEASGGR